MPTPLSAGKKPKVTDRRYLRPAEARRMIEAAGKRGRYPFRDRVLLRLVYRHGLRASEAVGMRWSQVDRPGRRRWRCRRGLSRPPQLARCERISCRALLRKLLNGSSSLSRVIALAASRRAIGL